MDELQRLSADEFKATQKTPIVVILENVRSMHNVGSVFRTCDAFLVESLLLCGYTPQPPHRDINKTALGATDTVSWQYFPTAIAAVEHLKAGGFQVWALEQAMNSLPLQQSSNIAAQKLAIVLGNEVEGVQQEVLAYCDGCLEIPQFGMKHSLNVSVAAGMVLWELVRNRLS